MTDQENAQDLTKYYQVRLHYKFWMTSAEGQNVISEERLDLLIAIHKEGTLMAAAQKLDISYRKAWGDLKATEALLGFPLIEKHRGGKDGGMTVLTPDGKTLIEAYADFRVEFQDAVSDIIRKFKSKIKGVT